MGALACRTRVGWLCRDTTYSGHHVCILPGWAPFWILYAPLKRYKTHYSVSYPLLNTNTVVDIAALDANGDINFATNRGYEEDYAGYEGYPARCVPALIRPLYKIRICEDRCINILGWAH